MPDIDVRAEFEVIDRATGELKDIKREIRAVAREAKNVTAAE